MILVHCTVSELSIEQKEAKLDVEARAVGVIAGYKPNYSLQYTVQNENFIYTNKFKQPVYYNFVLELHATLTIRNEQCFWA